MADNEPLFGILKAYQMKMYRSVEAKRVHEDMVKYHNNIANYNKRMMSKTDVMIRVNRIYNRDLFAKFWELA